MDIQLENTHPWPSQVDRVKLQRKQGYFFVKVLIDKLLSTLGLLLLIPVFAIVALAIKLEDPKGPVFFKQQRVGKDGVYFDIYKFRSMCVDAEIKLAELRNQNEVEGLMFKMKEDPRITRVGRFIRKYSIDELPQLINVLIGDMTLIGPRPPLVSEYAEYNDYHKQRLLVRPGCSGLWQVTGRNDVSFEEMVKLDIEYIDTMSLLNDFKIILLTVKVMLIPNNAA